MPRSDSFQTLLRELLGANCHVLVALSGGIDSVCLLHRLACTPGLTVSAAHFHHGIRGAEADRDQAFARSLCETLSIPFYTERADVPVQAQQSGEGLEACGRRLRYAYLERVCDAIGADVIATAHNADDNAETILMHLCRGTGTQGLGGIPPRRGRIIRPLLTTTREEIEQYISAHQLPHVEDSTNASDDYTRNKLRHQVLPVLREINPRVSAHMGAAAALARDDDACLLQEAQAFLGEERCILSVSALLALPHAVAMRALRLCCSPALSYTQASSIYAICRHRNRDASVSVSGCTVTREGDRLYFVPPPPLPAPLEKTPLALGVTELPSRNCRILLETGALSRTVHNSFKTFVFQNDNIYDRMYVASRQPGDCVCLQGRHGTKPLRKLFIERGLTEREKRQTLVFYDQQGVIAVQGFGVASRVAVNFNNNNNNNNNNIYILHIQDY